MEFIKASEHLPLCDQTPDSLGVEVSIKPAIDGDHRAFYGRRVSAEACFYRCGAKLEGVKSWCLTPSISLGSRWKERDGRFDRNILVVADSRSPNAQLRASGYEHVSVPHGKIGVVTIDADGNPGSRVSYCMPERFEGRSGGYAPL